MCGLAKRVAQTMREWRNGRRAGLRSQYFGVWVQVPSPAPSGKGLEPFRVPGLFLCLKQLLVFRDGSKVFMLVSGVALRRHAPPGPLFWRDLSGHPKTLGSNR